LEDNIEMDLREPGYLNLGIETDFGLEHWVLSPRKGKRYIQTGSGTHAAYWIKAART
jgi:hypothetical protein